MDGTAESANAVMVASGWSEWLPLGNVLASIVLAAAALWSLRTANKIAAVKNPAPYGQSRILWILERLVSDLEAGENENAQVHVRSLNLHFFDHSATARRESKNTESGDWYFVWDMEKAYSEFLRVTNGDSDGIPFVGEFANDMDQRRAIAAARKMLETQLELIDKIHKG